MKMEASKTEEQVVTNQAPTADPALLDAIKALTGAVAEMKRDVDAVKAHADKQAVNDPGYAAPAVIKDASHWRFDNMSLGDLALAVGTLREARLSNVSRRGVSDAAVKALAMRLESDDRKEDEGFIEALSGMKAQMPHIKANEIQQSTLANYGDEWVGVAYGTEVWRSIRNATPIINLQMQHAVPQPAGAESLVFPLEGGDPTWYLVAQAANLSANPGGIPTNTVTASQMGTAQQSRTMAKLGARVLWTGELEEDAFVPFVAQLREQLVASGAEMLESLIIDGDTATANATNINDIAGTPAGTEYWLGLNGYRKLALVTNTANSRDGGALDINDFLETIKLMGANGRNAMQKDRLAFILSLPTYWKALDLPEVKTRDVNSAATVENGELARAWGYRVYTTENMHGPAAAAGYELKTNAAGKIDQDTGSNNTKGAILAVRFDQWRPGYRRQMTIETTRIPAADATEIVALMRFGMIYRDTEASAISYNLTV